MKILINFWACNQIENSFAKTGHCQHSSKFVVCVVLFVMKILINFWSCNQIENSFAKTGHCQHSSKFVVCVVLFVIRTVLSLIVLFYVLFVCKCVLYCCYWVSTQLQLTNIYVLYLCHMSYIIYLPIHQSSSREINFVTLRLTLYLIKWRIWWAQNNARKGQMGFNSGFKGLNRKFDARCKYWQTDISLLGSGHL
jgi:hypothetical protein